MFADRVDAGQELAQAVRELLETDTELATHPRPPVIAALPRGGAPVALEIARTLGAPLDLVLVRKIGVRWQPELAAAAVVNGDRPEVVRNESVLKASGMTEADLQDGVDTALGEIDRRRALWFGDSPRPELAGRIVVVVDDGIATGSTALAALRALARKGPAAVILAVPVAPPDSVERLGREADRVVCLETPRDFMAVGQFYRDFRQTSDEEVAACLEEARGFAG